jgi:cbb3-type cytochrome oxidase subunit 3
VSNIFLAEGVRTLRAMASEQQTSDSLVSRVQTLIADNRRTILIGTVALAVAVGGVGYYAYSTRSRTEYDDEDGAEKGDAERRRKKKALKKRKSMKDDDGPLLEERREVTVEDVGGCFTLIDSSSRKAHSIAFIQIERPKLTKAEIEALPIEVDLYFTIFHSSNSNFAMTSGANTPGSVPKNQRKSSLSATRFRSSCRSLHASNRHFTKARGGLLQ